MFPGHISEAMNNRYLWITRSIMKQIGTAVYSTTELLMHRFLSGFTVVRLETTHIQLFSMDMGMDIALIQGAGYL